MFLLLTMVACLLTHILVWKRNGFFNWNVHLVFYWLQFNCEILFFSFHNLSNIFVLEGLLQENLKVCNVFDRRINTSEDSIVKNSNIHWLFFFVYVVDSNCSNVLFTFLRDGNTYRYIFFFETVKSHYYYLIRLWQIALKWMSFFIYVYK